MDALFCLWYTHENTDGIKVGNKLPSTKIETDENVMRLIGEDTKVFPTKEFSLCGARVVYNEWSDIGYKNTTVIGFRTSEPREIGNKEGTRNIYFDKGKVIGINYIQSEKSQEEIKKILGNDIEFLLPEEYL